MTDVAIASRSIATADLRDALLRLTEVARRRVCITLATGSPPRRRAHPDRWAARCSGATTCTPSTSWPMRESRRRCAISTAPATIRSPLPKTPMRSWPAMIDDSAAVRFRRGARAGARQLAEWLAANRSQRDRRRPDRKGVPNSPGALPSLAPSPGPSSPGIPTSDKKGQDCSPGPLASCPISKTGS